MCPPFRTYEPPRYPTAFRINYGVTWRRGMFGDGPIYGGKLSDYQNQLRRIPITEAPPASRIIPRKVPGMEDQMGILDYIFPARRRRREEERRRADARFEARTTYGRDTAPQSRQASPDTSFDLTSPLNLMSPLHPFNPINMGASFHVPDTSPSPSVGSSSGGGDSGGSGGGYSSSDSGGSSGGGSGE